MIEYQNENKKFSLNLVRDNINTESRSKILNLSVCQDTSSIIISTEKISYMIFSFQDILTIPKSLKKAQKFNKLDKKVTEFIEQEKKGNKSKKNNLLSEIIFEMNPSQKEDVSMAISLGKRIWIIQILKGSSIEIEHGENSVCKFIRWIDELLICAFENRVIKIFKNYEQKKMLTDDNIFTSMKIVHWQDFNLLVLGYNKKVRIFHFYDIYINNEFKPFTISKLEGDIDIIEHKNKYILFCSKEDKIIYCYCFTNNNIEPKILFEIKFFNFKGLDSEQEIINIKLISYEGIIVSFTNKIYIFRIKNDWFELDSIINEPQDNIYFSSLIYIYNRAQYYLIYSLQDKIKIIEIKINNVNQSDLIEGDIENNKRILNTCINTLLNRKNEFLIKKVDDYVLHIEIDVIVLKLVFDISNLSFNFSILKCFGDNLKMKLEEEIKKIELNQVLDNIESNEYNEIITEKIILLNRIIKNLDLSESTSEGESELGKLKIEEFLENYKIFKSWKSLIKLPFQNLFNEEDEFESDLIIDKKLINEPIKNLLQKWDFKFDELNIDKAFTFANSNYYCLFNANKSDEDKNISQAININSDKKNKKKKIPKENYLMLTDLLAQIKYYIQEILNQNSENLINLYRESILDILLILKSELNLEFLFICIIPLSELIWKEINKMSNQSLTKSPFKYLLIKNKSQRNSDNNERKNIKKDLSGASWSSELDNDNINDVLNGNEDKDDLSLEFYTEEYKNILPSDNNNKYINKINNNNLNKKRKNSEDIYKSKKIIFHNKIYNNYWSLYSNKMEKNLIEKLTSSFCNSIIDYVNFFVEKLKLLNDDSHDEKVIDFFQLANKYYEDSNINNEILEIIKKPKQI